MNTKFKTSGKKKALNHWLKDPRWTTEDKVFQYKGVLKLEGRQRKIENEEAVRLQKKICTELETLKAEVKEFQGVLRGVQCGGERRLHKILAGHKDLQLAYGDRDPDTAYRGVVDNCDLKLKHLNKLYYLKTSKIKEFFDLQLEWTSLIIEYEDQNTLKDPDLYKRKIVHRYRKAIANKQAAESLRLTYLLMIDGLEKDKLHFDEIIDTLEYDRKEQNQLVIKAKRLGQLAARDLEEARETSKTMMFKLWKSIKAREKTIKIFRERVKNLGSNIRLLVRVESNKRHTKKISEKSLSIDKSLEEDVQSLEKTLERVKNVLVTQSYDDFLTRLKEQARQKTRLLKLLKKSLEERDSLLYKKNNATIILNRLKESILTNGDYDEFEAKKREILRQLEIEKKREADSIELRKSRGVLLVNIKTVLQNMLSMMVCIEPDMEEKQPSLSDIKPEDEKIKDSETKIDKVQLRMKLQSLFTDESESENVDTDAISLLIQVTEKVITLFEMSNFNLSPEEEEQAKHLYQSYIAEYKSKALFKRQESGFSTFIIEHEIVDTSVMTRDDIKLQSKLLVIAKTKTD